MHKFLTHPRTLCTAIALVFSMPAMSEEVPVVSKLTKNAPATSTSTTASSLNIPTLLPSLPTTSITPEASAPVTIPVTPSVATQTVPVAPAATLSTSPVVVSTTTPTPTAVITPVPAVSISAPSVASAIAPATTAAVSATLPSAPVAVPNVTSAIAPAATTQSTVTPLIPLPAIVATTPASSTPATSISPATPSATKPAVAEVPRVVSAESQMSPQQVAELPRNILVPPAIIDTDDPLAIQIKAIDRSDINARITLLGKYARHYPPHFETKRARRAAEIEAVDLANVTNDAANGSKPTFEQLIQAVKANCLAHNMDVGDNTAGNANTFIRQALKLKPNDGEANFLYGVLLSESGGMKEGLPYLNKSAKVGFNEAYLSLANAYLSLNQKPKALAALSSYKKVVPNDMHYDDMVDAVKTNKASIW